MPKKKEELAANAPAEEFLPCRIMELPQDSLVLAASTAVHENPHNSPALTGILLSPDRLTALTQKYWKSGGVKLTVGFMDETSAALRDRILSHFNAWGAFCNASFVYSAMDPQVRITREGSGYWSYLGTDILHVPRNQPTMCLQGFTMQTRESECIRVIRHEVGHTMGFPHEHLRKDIIEQIDIAKALAFFLHTQGWNADTVRQNVLTPLNERSIMGSPTADELSLMCYRLPGSIMKDGQPVLGGEDFSPQDIVTAGKIYPLPMPPVEPPVSVNGLQMALDFDKKRVTISLPAGWTVAKA